MPTFKVRVLRGIPYAICAFKSQVFKVSSGVTVPKGYWDFKKHRLKRNCPQRDVLQSMIDLTLNTLIRHVNALILAGKDPIPEAIRSSYDAARKPTLPPFFSYFAQYINLKKSRVAQGTYKNLYLAKNSLERFAKTLSFPLTENSFDKVVFEKYIAYQLEVEEYSDFTIGKHLKKIREFMKWAYPTVRIDHLKYNPPQVEDPVFLTEQELKILKEAALCRKVLQKVRDLFLFCCFTGMRYSDSQRFSTEWIQEDLIIYRMQKTNGKAIVPVREKVLEISDRWGGKAPQISSQKCNDYLKVLFRELGLGRKVACYTYAGGRMTLNYHPLNEIITTHFARKTFITQCLLHGIPIQDVMRMSGHSDYQSMKPYIAITNQHLKEVAKRWEI
ncbi:MAG: site-specific integrase [Candidatus Methanomethylophilaceae archaeon]|nr:site-specific integrase [Candidatus Methanomethylophilaceae archaeon]